MLHTLGTVKGGGKNKMLSIARCGTFQGVKKKKDSIWDYIKQNQNNIKPSKNVETLQ